MKRCGRTRILWLLVAAVCAVACSHAPDAPLDRAAALISTDRIGRLGRALKSDEMSGRYYASPEADSAAGVLLVHLRALHLPIVQRAENLLSSQPACFAHHFSVTLYRLGGRNRQASGSGGEHSAELGRDFEPLVFSRSESAEGRCVRLDGITADATAPLAGAIVLVDLHNTRPSDAELYARVRRFEARGAAGVVFAGEARLLTSPATTYPTHLSSEQHAVADSP